MKHKLVSYACLLSVFLVTILSIIWYRVSYKEIVSLIEPYRGDVWTIYFPRPNREDYVIECNTKQIDCTFDLFPKLGIRKVLNPKQAIDAKDSADLIDFEIIIQDPSLKIVSQITLYEIWSTKYLLIQTEGKTYIYKVFDKFTNKYIAKFQFSLDYVGSL